MNLLAKRGKWWLIAITVIFCGCKDDLGLEVPPGEETTESVFVELNLPITNVFIDSLRTDRAGQLIVGQYADPTYGSVTAESYFEFSFKEGISTDSLIWDLRTIQVNPDSTVTVGDSIADFTLSTATLRLRVNQLISGDNQIEQTLIAHDLADSIFSSGIYLSNRTLPVNDEIGRGSIFVPAIENFDVADDTVVVSIDVTSPEMTDAYALAADNIFSFKKGMKLSSEMSNGLWSFLVNDDTTELEFEIQANVYDTIGDASIRADTLLYARFRVSPSNHFINLSRDFTGTQFDGAVDGQEIDSDPTNVYYNSIAGIYPMVDLQPFLDFAQGEVQFLATLGQFELEGSVNGETIPGLGSTRFYFANENSGDFSVNWPGILTSSIYSTVLLTDDSYQGSPASIQLMQLDTLSLAPFTLGYIQDFTSFWQAMHQNTRDDLNGIAEEDRPFPNSFLTEVNKLLLHPGAGFNLGQGTLPKDGVTLRLFYTKLKD